ncbi:hypothetical protein KCU71_g119, partial [Aureobasidium melanogenum]
MLSNKPLPFRPPFSNHFSLAFSFGTFLHRSTSLLDPLYLAPQLVVQRLAQVQLPSPLLLLLHLVSLLERPELLERVWLQRPLLRPSFWPTSLPQALEPFSSLLGCTVDLLV